jgi:hypothetical protein
MILHQIFTRFGALFESPIDAAIAKNRKAKTGPTLLFHKRANQWTAKFKGKFVCFGVNQDEAIALYQKELPERQARAVFRSIPNLDPSSKSLASKKRAEFKWN